jgi:acyl carrier protein
MSATVESAIFDLVQSAIVRGNARDISDDRPLSDFGVDSASTIRLIVALENHFGVEIPEDKFSTCRTLRGIRETVAGLL